MELLLAPLSWAALLLGMVYFSETPLVIAAWVISFVLARVLVAKATSWRKLNNAQCMVLPPLILGYLVILSAMLLWPAATIGALGSAPAIFDTDASPTFLGYRYEELTHDGVIPPYWLMVAAVAATVTLLWCVAFAQYSKKHPRPFSFIFHPADESTIEIVATYVMCVALITLGPLALTLGCILAFVTE